LKKKKGEKRLFSTLHSRKEMLPSVARSAHSSGVSVFRSSQSPRAAAVVVVRSARAAPLIVSVGRITRGAAAPSINASASSSRVAAFSGALSRPPFSSARIQLKGAPT